MIDSNETLIYENGRDAGYSEGFESALETVKEKLDECVCTGEYPNGEDYRYIPYEYYKEIMDELLSIEN